MLSAVFGDVIAGIRIGCVAGKGNDQWNRYGVRLIKICASLFRGTDACRSLTEWSFVGLYVFGLKPALYAMVAFLSPRRFPTHLMEGMKYSKAAFIIITTIKKLQMRS